MRTLLQRTIGHTVVLALLAVVPLRAAEGESALAAWDPALLVSEDLCMTCHAAEDMGNQTGAWEKTRHAKAYQTLATDKAKEIAAKQGVAEPQKSGKCLSCHATAYGFTEAAVGEVLSVEQGVTCQGCHGPGSKYKSKTKHGAKVREASLKLGMIVPTEQNMCVRCHNPSNPTHDPARYTRADGTKVDFDFGQASKKIEHKVVKAGEAGAAEGEKK
jgi:cytochrome c551/c552